MYYTCESLATIRLDSEVCIEDVNEALRLIRVSTMAANSTDQNSSLGERSVLTNSIERAQRFLRMRSVAGSAVNNQKLD